MGSRVLHMRRYKYGGKLHLGEWQCQVPGHGQTGKRYALVAVVARVSDAILTTCVQP